MPSTQVSLTAAGSDCIVREVPPLGSLSRKLGQVHRLSGLQGPAAEGLNNGCARFRLSPGSRTVQRS